MFHITGLKYKKILDIPRLTIDRPVTCIVGASGSGKTTLLRLLNRLSAPDEGKIEYNGEDIAAMDPVKLRRRVVMLGQTPVIYPGDIRDNLQIGLELSQRLPAPESALCESLRSVGLDKNLDEGCGALSGGEKQRLCLARVLLMDAETYLLDEPSSALDRETERFLVDHLAEFVRERDRQLIMVTHSEAVAGRYPGSTIRIEAGRTEGYRDEQ